jgi:hypothetical protein
MPRGKHIKIHIGIDGQCSINAINFTGPACQSATMEIANALGMRIITDRQKPEIRMRERAIDPDREATR